MKAKQSNNLLDLLNEKIQACKTLEDFNQLLDSCKDNNDDQYAIVQRMPNHIFSIYKGNTKNYEHKEFRNRVNKIKEKRRYDDSPALIRNINVACTALYRTVIKMIAELNNAQNSTDVDINELKIAINRVEEHIGLNKTKWTYDINTEEEK